MDKAKEIRIIFQNTSITCGLPKTFNDLLKKITTEVHQLQNYNPQLLEIKYPDDDGDKILISNQFDYEQAIIFFNHSKLHTIQIIVSLANDKEGYFTCAKCKLISQGKKYECTTCKYSNYCQKCEEDNFENHTHPVLRFRKLDIKPKDNLDINNMDKIYE